MLEVSFHRVRPEKVARLRDWLAEVQARRTEVLETFTREGVRHEIASLIATAEGPVLVYAIERDPAIDAHGAFSTSELPIDVRHFEVLEECLAGPAPSERLLDVALDP